MPKFDSVATAVVVDHAELENLIKRYYRKKLALFIWGPTGIGKSQTVKKVARDIAKELGLEYSESIKDINDPKKFVVIDLRLSQMDPSDLRGIPVWDKETRSTVWLPPNTFPREGQGIIFFDELNLAPPLVQASAYQLILDRRLGEYVVPEGYSLIAAGNRLEDRANVFEMAAPLKNRFGHCQLNIPRVEDWTDWAVRHGIDMRIIGFLQVRRTALFSFTPNLKENAFATPRAYEHLSKLIKDIPSSDLSTIQKIAATQIGEGLESELVSFIRLKDKLNPIDYYLKKPDKCELPDEQTEMDLVWALLTSLAEYYGSKKDTDTIRRIVKVLNRMNEEYAVFTLKLMLTVDQDFTQKMMRVPEVGKLAKKLVDFFE